MDAARRHDLDWIRIGAFTLLILYHVGMYYVTWDYHVKSPHASSALQPWLLLTAPWRLGLLFLVSGAASAFLLARDGAGFAAARSRRLLIPLAFGMLVVVVPQAYFEVVEKLGWRGGYLAFWGRYLAGDRGFCLPQGCLVLPTWNHLWFVAYLWVYTMGLWALRRWLPGLLARLEDGAARALGGIGVLLWPAAWAVAMRVLLQDRFPTTHALVDDFYNHAVFAPAFLLGALVARRVAVWEALRRVRWLALALALPCSAFLAWHYGSYSAEHPAPLALVRAERVLFALDQWWAIAAVLGFGRAWSPGDSTLLRYLTQAVFPFYIVHQTALILVVHALRPLDLAPSVEGPLLVAATFASCFASFELIRRVDWLRPLFGLRPRSRARPPPTAPRPDPA